MVSPFEKPHRDYSPAFSSVELLVAERPLSDDESGFTRKDFVCRVEQEERTQCFSLEDYQQVYAIPGLYEHLFYEKLSCRSLDVVSRMFIAELQKQGGLKEKLRVLDLGAGNGLVGERIQQCAHGSRLFERLVGIDLLEAAKSAAERDRAGLYHQYYVSDFSKPQPELEDALRQEEFNCLTSISRLGFNDISAPAFANSFNLIQPEAYVLFNLKEGIYPDDGDSDFGHLVRRMLEEGILLPKTFERYSHCLDPSGKSRYYIACIARKKKEIPASLLSDILR